MKVCTTRLNFQIRNLAAAFGAKIPVSEAEEKALRLMDKIISPHGHRDLAAEPVVSPEVAAERAALEKFELGRFLLAIWA